MERPTIFGVFTGKLGKSEGYNLPITSAVVFLRCRFVGSRKNPSTTNYEVKHTTFHFHMKFYIYLIQNLLLISRFHHWRFSSERRNVSFLWLLYHH